MVYSKKFAGPLRYVLSVSRKLGFIGTSERLSKLLTLLYFEDYILIEVSKAEAFDCIKVSSNWNWRACL